MQGLSGAPARIEDIWEPSNPKVQSLSIIIASQGYCGALKRRRHRTRAPVLPAAPSIWEFDPYKGKARAAYFLTLGRRGSGGKGKGRKAE